MSLACLFLAKLFRNTFATLIQWSPVLIICTKRFVPAAANFGRHVCYVNTDTFFLVLLLLAVECAATVLYPDVAIHCQHLWQAECDIKIAHSCF